MNRKCRSNGDIKELLDKPSIFPQLSVILSITCPKVLRVSLVHAG